MEHVCVFVCGLFFLPLFCLNDSSSNSASKTASTPVLHVLNTRAHDQKNGGSEMGYKVNNDVVVQGGGYAAFHSVTQKQDVFETRTLACEFTVCVCVCVVLEF